MKDFFSDIQVGDMVYIDGDSGFCTGSDEVVTETRIKYDQDTGEQYKAICCGSHEFDTRSGMAITPPTAYYISIKE